MLIGIAILAGIALIYAIIMSFRYGNDQVRERHLERVAWGTAKGLQAVDSIRENPGFMSGPLTPVPNSRLDHLRPSLVHNGVIQNLLEGHSVGRKVEIFDLTVTGTQDSPDSHFGYVAVALNRAGPSFEIIPRTGWHRFIGGLGFNGLKTNDLEFDEKLQIPASSDSRLLKYLDSGLRARLLNNLVYSYRSNGRHLVVRKDVRCANGEFEEMLSIAQFFADKLEEKR